MIAALLDSQIVRFGLVGASAFALHWTSVVTILNFADLSPLVANCFGFLLAFALSYFGHKNWTFAARNQPHATSLRRFSMVSLAGFLINESSYAVLLNHTSLSYRQGLVIALGVAAMSTFLLSRFWAFADRHRSTAAQPAAGKAVVCADDFGYSEGISKAILELCARRKITATSVMADSPWTHRYADRLDKHRTHVQIGLHFNLTEHLSGKAGNDVFPLRSLVLALWARKTTRERIVASLDRQLDQFEALFGRPPDFVDGHHHVHIMPFVRGIFLERLKQRYARLKKKPWIRQVSPSLRHTDARLKAGILKVLNIGFRTKCRKYGFAYNENFAGVYSFKPFADYRKLFDCWLENSPPKLIMCHPSLSCSENDAIWRARRREYEVLVHLST